MKAFIITKKDYCPYCERALNLLESKGIEYEKKVIGLDYSKEQLLELVPTAKTVPQIWIDDEYVGGSDALTKWFEEVKE